MQTTVKFFCQNCGCPIVADGAAAGESFQCFKCPEMVTIPPPRALMRVDQDASIAECRTDANGIVMAQSLVSHAPPVSTAPVELRLPGGQLGLKANVDQKTSNAMATTFLGALLVAFGAMLAVMLGGKDKA
ncbi:MAG: hypothetical protein LC104_01620 [Bacteroidales bacterium]|nr:hypothetical protein [Bacteroidales bacterium]